MRRTIQVSGTPCGGCERTVEEGLSAVSGVLDAEADREAGTVTGEGDAPVDELVRAVDDAGDEASARGPGGTDAAPAASRGTDIGREPRHEAASAGARTLSPLARSLPTGYGAGPRQFDRGGR